MKNFKTIRPGDVVLDYASWRPTEEQLKSIGTKAVVRYIAPNSNIDKIISRSEADFLHSIGIAYLPVFEWSATRANQGEVAGTSDAIFSNKYLHETLNYHPVGTVIVAIDMNTTLINHTQHEAYSRAFDRNLMYENMGIYGDSDIIGYCVQENLTVLNWLMASKSFGHSLEGVHVEQVLPGSTGSYDMNKVHKEFKVWLPGWEEDDEEMIYILNNKEPREFEGQLIPVGGLKYSYNSVVKRRLTTEYGELYAVGSPLNSQVIETPATNACLDSIPDYKEPVGGPSNCPTTLFMNMSGEGSLR